MGRLIDADKLKNEVISIVKGAVKEWIGQTEKSVINVMNAKSSGRTTTPKPSVREMKNPVMNLDGVDL